MSHPSQTNNSSGEIQSQLPEDFLTPEQRSNAVAEILATIALRIAKDCHETQNSDFI
jgi:hypothetical protein